MTGFRADIHSDKLSEFINAIGIIRDAGLMNFEPNGISISLRDIQDIAQVKAILSRRNFIEYASEGLEYGVNLNKMLRFIKCTNEGTTVTPIILEAETANTKLKVTNNHIYYNQHPYSPGSFSPNQPIDMLLDARATLRGSEFASIMRTIYNDGDYIKMQITEEALHICGYDPVIESAPNTNSDKDDGDVTAAFTTEINVYPAKTSVKSIFNIDFLCDIAEQLKATENVTLHLGQDQPLVIEAILPKSRAELTYTIAPRIEGTGIN